MNQLHNNDVMNVNRQCTDGLIKQVTEDDVMNMNRQSSDDSMDESHKMTSQMDQMMSQQQQVEETTPGHSQELFKTPETVNLTEKSGSSCQRNNRQHNDGKVPSLGSLLGVPVKLSNGIADKKQQSNFHTLVTN